MIGEEDLFSFAARKVNTLVISYGEMARRRFDESNRLVTFDKLAETLSSGEWPCFITKRNETEFQISIPMTDLGGQFDLVVEYNNVNYLYKMMVQYNTKTRYKALPSLPNPDFCLQMMSRFAFIDEKSGQGWPNFDDLSAMREVKERALKLEISPEMSIETQQSIWDLYIEAQSQIIDRLHQPYECIDEPRITSEKRQNGDGVFKYKAEFRLQPTNLNEYDPLRRKLKEDLNVETDFDSEGVAFLTWDNITRALDPVIRKNFPEQYEREQKVGCILSVRPYWKAEKIQESHGHLASFEQHGIVIQANDVKVPVSRLVEEMASIGYIPQNVGMEYTVDGVDNLFHSEHVDRFSITFGNRFVKDKGEKEMLLPEPVDGGTKYRIERGWSEDYQAGFMFLTQALRHIYGEENVHQTVYFKFKPEERIDYVPGFTDEQWMDIRKDIYAFDWEPTYGDADDGKTIYFEFENREELERKFADLSTINKFVIKKSPLDEDFGFKVTTHLTAKKTAQQEFRENLDRLNGADFVYEFVHVNEDTGKSKKEFIPIGKLNSYESSMDKLVFNIPNMFKDDQKQAEIFLKFIQKHPRMESIHANLAGDRAKITWLQEALAKLKTTGSWEPNSHAVNEKIKDFIFDSSKAEPVYRYEQTAVTDTDEFKDFDRTAVLSLNDSQKEAVLKGVAARDLCMLQGPPGTGKTTVIAELIWQHIRQNQNSRLLLTSETNLAVDNALEKLMNGKAANPDMVRYLTLIKPLRFGKAEKFEEEGKRYSIERIEKWIDGNVEVHDDYDYDSEVLSGEGVADPDEIEEGDVRDNVIQRWMDSIADRSSADSRYRDVLKDWQLGLAQPDVLTKEYFRDLYFKHVNVVGSTCSSTGSPAFMTEYLSTFMSLSKEQMQGLKKGLRSLKRSENKDRYVEAIATVLGIEDCSPMEMRNAVSNACSVKFDTVIMDEASKATPPELLLPLCFGKKSIVIGDHRQLPPMLNEKSFREALVDLGSDRAVGLADEIDRNFVETSQFKRMILNKQVSRTIKATFNTQYRMHPRINDVISQFYENDECGGLRCGLDPMKVDSPDLSDPQSRYHGFYKDGFINPSVHTIWVNVDAPESNDGSSKVNATEIAAINKVLDLLNSSDGFAEYMDHWDGLKSETKRKEEKEIGVISFYGKQVRKIRESVRPHARKLGMQIKMNTVDKFQGMERNIVIVSTVRSDKADRGNNRIEVNRESGFAKSPERLNVALSRARRLLIVVGNKDFFSQIRDKEGNYLYRNAINEIERSGRVINFKDLSNE